MKRLTKPTLAVSLAIILFGCSKNDSDNSPNADQGPKLHSYGVLPMQPEQWAFVPEFSTAIVLENARLGTRSGKYTYNPLNADGTLISGVNLLGGHAVPIIGYIDDASQPGGGVFIVQNSWGTGWGYKGYFYMPYSVLKSKTIVSSGSLYVAII